MSKIFFTIVSILVLFGFLIAKTISLYEDIDQMKNENLRLSGELDELRTNYNIVIQERDAMKVENLALSAKLNEVSQAYTAEIQARMKAEADSDIYKGMMVDMMENEPTASTMTCNSTDEQLTTTPEIFLSSMAPFGAGSLTIFAMASLFLVIKNHLRKVGNRKIR